MDAIKVEDIVMHYGYSYWDLSSKAVASISEDTDLIVDVIEVEEV